MYTYIHIYVCVCIHIPAHTCRCMSIYLYIYMYREIERRTEMGLSHLGTDVICLGGICVKEHTHIHTYLFRASRYQKFFVVGCRPFDKVSDACAAGLQTFGPFGRAECLPRGPCRYIIYMAYTCALQGTPYHDFMARVCTRMVLGPFGSGMSTWTSLHVEGSEKNVGSTEGCVLGMAMAVLDRYLAFGCWDPWDHVIMVAWSVRRLQPAGRVLFQRLCQERVPGTS